MIKPLNWKTSHCQNLRCVWTWSSAYKHNRTLHGQKSSQCKAWLCNSINTHLCLTNPSLIREGGKKQTNKKTKTRNTQTFRKKNYRDFPLEENRKSICSQWDKPGQKIGYGVIFAPSNRGRQMTTANWKTNEVQKSSLDSGVCLCVWPEKVMRSRMKDRETGQPCQEQMLIKPTKI